ncbi:hypothetical protein SAMD00019534_111720 [Acytostelium subglobosum LB1]|uniref:hypothetical protein n=1 Tax=Acytostelium subglobosum LB1 TaxID=1410327 RepID=UPI000644FA01|nr:hypothetical protein SAMD00019534_111720 [Acytostelium subglobosum LB1]GAM27996.1 hypothetical protein SAMD00019534_111720 [Acytostelium subglobosum LB1]|eukprot:XP_012748955.1 hypothetical protein SAMD00019534_111720 [Acytostelium subglobosum LB1]
MRSTPSTSSPPFGSTSSHSSIPPLQLSTSSTINNTGRDSPSGLGGRGSPSSHSNPLSHPQSHSSPSFTSTTTTTQSSRSTTPNLKRSTGALSRDSSPGANSPRESPSGHDSPSLEHTTIHHTEFSPGVARPAEKKRRTRLKKDQSRVLKEFFEKDNYPNKEEKERLATTLNMTYSAVTTWFSNKRQEKRRKETDGMGGRRLPVTETDSPNPNSQGTGLTPHIGSINMGHGGRPHMDPLTLNSQQAGSMHSSPIPSPHTSRSSTPPTPSYNRSQLRSTGFTDLSNNSLSILSHVAKDDIDTQQSSTCNNFRLGF